MTMWSFVIWVGNKLHVVKVPRCSSTLHVLYIVLSLIFGSEIFIWISTYDFNVLSLLSPMSCNFDPSRKNYIILDTQAFLTPWARISLSRTVWDFSASACCLSSGSESFSKCHSVSASNSQIMLISIILLVICHVNCMQNMKLTAIDVQEMSL